MPGFRGTFPASSGRRFGSICRPHRWPVLHRATSGPYHPPGSKRAESRPGAGPRAAAGRGPTGASLTCYVVRLACGRLFSLLFPSQGDLKILMCGAGRRGRRMEPPPAGKRGEPLAALVDSSGDFVKRCAAVCGLGGRGAHEHDQGCRKYECPVHRAPPCRIRFACILLYPGSGGILREERVVSEVLRKTKRQPHQWGGFVIVCPLLSANDAGNWLRCRS